MKKPSKLNSYSFKDISNCVFYFIKENIPTCLTPNFESSAKLMRWYKKGAHFRSNYEQNSQTHWNRDGEFALIFCKYLFWPLLCLYFFMIQQSTFWKCAFWNCKNPSGNFDGGKRLCQLYFRRYLDVRKAGKLFYLSAGKSHEQKH